jgi:hypothetical protein
MYQLETIHDTNEMMHEMISEIESIITKHIAEYNKMLVERFGIPEHELEEALREFSGTHYETKYENFRLNCEPCTEQLLSPKYIFNII